tara:strand:- start:208 stop:519 length:312 start_codon:yes stop_codon:yes gene_type:complete
MLNIYLVSRKEDLCIGWDEYENFVVICESPVVARGVHPNGEHYSENEEEFYSSEWARCWVSPEKVKVMCIGRCELPEIDLKELSKVQDSRVEAYVVNYSFNAG